jgi:hypothetical protein
MGANWGRDAKGRTYAGMIMACSRWFDVATALSFTRVSMGHTPTHFEVTTIASKKGFLMGRLGSKGGPKCYSQGGPSGCFCRQQP